LAFTYRLHHCFDPCGPQVEETSRAWDADSTAKADDVALKKRALLHAETLRYAELEKRAAERDALAAQEVASLTTSFVQEQEARMVAQTTGESLVQQLSDQKQKLKAAVQEGAAALALEAQRRAACEHQMTDAMDNAREGAEAAAMTLAKEQKARNISESVVESMKREIAIYKQKADVSLEMSNFSRVQESAKCTELRTELDRSVQESVDGAAKLKEVLREERRARALADKSVLSLQRTLETREKELASMERCMERELLRRDELANEQSGALRGSLAAEQFARVTAEASVSRLWETVLDSQQELKLARTAVTPSFADLEGISVRDDPEALVHSAARRVSVSSVDCGPALELFESCSVSPVPRSPPPRSRQAANRLGDGEVQEETGLCSGPSPVIHHSTESTQSASRVRSERLVGDGLRPPEACPEHAELDGRNQSVRKHLPPQQRQASKGKVHRVDPDFGPTL
jgi:hypothetical protein